MKLKMKMKNRSQRYDINRLRARQGHKSTKQGCRRMMMPIFIKQHKHHLKLSINEKVKQHCD